MFRAFRNCRSRPEGEKWRARRCSRLAAPIESLAKVGRTSAAGSSPPFGTCIVRRHRSGATGTDERNGPVPYFVTSPPTGENRRIDPLFLQFLMEGGRGAGLYDRKNECCVWDMLSSFLKNIASGPGEETGVFRGFKAMAGSLSLRWSHSCGRYNGRLHRTLTYLVRYIPCVS